MYPLVLEALYRHNTFICQQIGGDSALLPPLHVQRHLRRLEMKITLESAAQDVAWGAGWITPRRLTLSTDNKGYGFEKLEEVVLRVEFAGAEALLWDVMRRYGVVIRARKKVVVKVERGMSYVERFSEVVSVQADESAVGCVGCVE